MAPVMAAEFWGAVGQSGVPTLSLVILFILTITLLFLCTSCQRESYDLEHNTPEERNSSTLVKVASLQNARLAMSNPVAADIKKDEKDLSPLSEDGATEFIQGQDVKLWRNHRPGDNTKETINGPGPPTTKGDSNYILNQRLSSIPPAPRPPVNDLKQRSVNQTVSTHTENILSTSACHSELPYSQVSLDNQTVHTYESIRLKKSDEPTGSLLNAYATHNSTLMHSSQGNGPNPSATPTLAKDLDEGHDCTDFSITYAVLSKNSKCSRPAPELPVDTETEVPDLPFPERS